MALPPAQLPGALATLSGQFGESGFLVLDKFPLKGCFGC